MSDPKQKDAIGLTKRATNGFLTSFGAFNFGFVFGKLTGLALPKKYALAISGGFNMFNMGFLRLAGKVLTETDPGKHAAHNEKLAKMHKTPNSLEAATPANTFNPDDYSLKDSTVAALKQLGYEAPKYILEIIVEAAVIYGLEAVIEALQGDEGMFESYLEDDDNLRFQTAMVIPTAAVVDGIVGNTYDAVFHKFKPKDRVLDETQQPLLNAVSSGGKHPATETINSEQHDDTNATSDPKPQRTTSNPDMSTTLRL